MPKNIQTTTQLCSFHMLARLCSKSSKLGCHRIWTENFQIYKLGFKDIEEPEIKLSTFVGLKRKQGNSRKNIWFTYYNKALSCVDHNKLWKLLRRWKYQTTLPVSWETCMRRQAEKTSSLVFPILLFSSMSLLCSFKKVFFSLLVSGTLH